MMNKSEPKIAIIISLGIAIVLWFYVMGEVDPNVTQKFSNIPVRIENRNSLEEKGLVLSADQEYTVDISVYGRTSSLYNLRKDIEASIDVSNIDEKGEYNLEATIQGLPDVVQLKNIYPEKIELKVDQLGEKRQEVEINIEGNPQRDLVVMGYSASPRSVALYGPEEMLKKVSKVVGIINVEGAGSNINESVQIQAVDSNGKVIEGVNISTSRCNVDVQIGKTKKVKIEPNLKGTPSEDYIITNITVNPKEIVLGAKDNRLGNIEKVLTEEINIEGIQSSVERVVKLQLPEGTDTVGNGTTEVKVNITVEEKVIKDYQIKTLKVINQPEDMDIIQPKEVNISIRLEGKSTDVEKLNIENIALYIDLKEILEGENTVKIQMEPLERITIKAITPSNMMITAVKRVTEGEETVE